MSTALLDHKKRELRSRLEAERSAQTQTVVSNRLASSTSPGVEFIVRSPKDLQPARQISRREIDGLNDRFWMLPYLPPERHLEEAFEIGFRLRCWHDLFSSDDLWSRWREVNITIPARSIAICILLWDNSDKIKKSLRKTGKGKQ